MVEMNFCMIQENEQLYPKQILFSKFSERAGKVPWSSCIVASMHSLGMRIGMMFNWRGHWKTCVLEKGLNDNTFLAFYGKIKWQLQAFFKLVFINGAKIKKRNSESLIKIGHIIVKLGCLTFLWVIKIQQKIIFKLAIALWL